MVQVSTPAERTSLRKDLPAMTRFGRACLAREMTPHWLAPVNDQTASPRRNRLLARKSAGRANSASVDGSGTVPPPVIVIVPSWRVAAISFPNGSDKLVNGNAVTETVSGPDEAPAATSKKMCASPTVAPAAIVFPHTRQKSDASRVWPGPDVLMIGPNNESPAKT